MCSRVQAWVSVGSGLHRTESGGACMLISSAWWDEEMARQLVSHTSGVTGRAFAERMSRGQGPPGMEAAPSSQTELRNTGKESISLLSASGWSQMRASSLVALPPWPRAVWVAVSRLLCRGGLAAPSAVGQDKPFRFFTIWSHNEKSNLELCVSTPHLLYTSRCHVG